VSRAKWVEQSESNKVSRTKWVGQSESDKVSRTKWVGQSESNKVSRTKWVEQSESNKVSRTKWVEQSESNKCLEQTYLRHIFRGNVFSTKTFRANVLKTQVPPAKLNTFAAYRVVKFICRPIHRKGRSRRKSCIVLTAAKNWSNVCEQRWHFKYITLSCIG
jgi:hypothetical protein